MCEISSKLIIKTSKRRQWHLSGVFNVNFEQISDIVFAFPLLTLITNNWWLGKCRYYLTLSVPPLQSYQNQSKNLSVTANELFECV